MDSDMGDVVVEEASHPFQVSFRPCFRAAPCHRTWLGERPCSRPFRRERRAVRRSQKKKNRSRHNVVAQPRRKDMDGPMGLCPGLVARPALWRSSRFEGLSIPLASLSAFLHSSLPSVFSGGLTASASLCCPCHAEMDVDREMRRMTCFLYLHPLFVKLKASVPCNSPTRFTASCQHVTAAIS